MDESYTHVSIILDRTGSMSSIRDDTIGGFNVFLKENKQQPGSVTLTLVQFDTQDPYEVIHQFSPINEVPELTRETYVPRAGTPLLDAIGRGINDLDQQLALLDDEEKPSGVVFVVITDGKENSSKEFRRDQIVKMINEKQEKDDWQFVFLSADLESINDALNYGFRDRSVMSYDKSAGGSREAWLSLSHSTSEYHRSKKMGFKFTDEDRDQQKSEQKRKKKP
jgi:hypothetical protein